MNALDRVISYFSPARGAKRAQHRAHLDMINARYDAAGRGRRNSYWNAANTSANKDISDALSILRARHRDLVQNNPYAENAVRVLVNNFIGTGVKPKAQTDNDEARKKAQDIINDWAESTAIDFDDQLDLFGIQGLATETMLMSGDCLIQKVNARDKRSKIPLKLKVLEGDFLDHMKNGAMNGGYAVLGVQFDMKGRKTGYWVFNKHPSDYSAFYEKAESQLIPASDIIHLFEIHRPGQVRGVPRGVSGMQRTKILDDYQDARLDAQRSAACLVGIITEPDAEPGSQSGDILPDKLEPGLFLALNSGQDVKFNSPPSIQDAGGFIKTEQRSIAIAYGVPYAALTGDLSNVNFSAGRMGALEFKREIDNFRNLRFIPTVCRRLGEWLKEAAELAGYDLSGVGVSWRAPLHQMQDPAREVAPLISMVRSGFKSKDQVIQELGGDPDETFEEIRLERERDEEAGLVFDTDPKVMSQQGYSSGVSRESDTSSGGD